MKFLKDTKLWEKEAQNLLIKMWYNTKNIKEIYDTSEQWFYYR